MLNQQVSRVRFVLRRHGLAGTARQALRYRQARRGRQSTEAADAVYDRTAGVDTAGVIPVWELGDVTGDHLPLCNRYEAVPPAVFHDLMGDVPADGATFIDLGCGKGRALLLARDYPFRRIVGVEFSRQLAAVAERNLAGEPRAEIICTDALDYRFPHGPLVVFANNPFRSEIMARVLEHLHAAPGPADVIALNPHICMPDTTPGFTTVGANRWRSS